MSNDDLLANADFRRYWLSSVINLFGGHIGGLALPLCALVLLHATPAQMGMLTAISAMPFLIFGLPVGVWLDRRTKLPVILGCELVFGLSLASIPVAYWLGILTMPWMYAVNFVYGLALVASGGAQQVFLTFLVGREKLVDVQAKLMATDSVGRLIGPGIAGLMVQWLSAPFAVLVNGISNMMSLWNMSQLKASETPPVPSGKHPLRDLKDGLAFVWEQPLLRVLAWTAAAWHILFYGYFALSLIFATRELGMSPGMIGTAQMLGAIGVMVSAATLKPLTRQFGEGPTILIGLACAGIALTMMPMLPRTLFGNGMATAAAYAALTFVFDCGAMLFMMPLSPLRQNVTPDEMLGRMIATMRFMVIAPAPLGALIAGYLGNRYGVRTGLACVAGAMLVVLAQLLFTTTLRKARINKPTV